MSSIRKSNLFKFTVFTAIFSLFVAGLVYFFPLTKSEQIVNFIEERDAKDIIQLFDKNRYWLIAASPHEHSLARDEYSPEFMLKYRTMDRNPANFGKLVIKVLRERDKFAGFTAYYKKSFYRGFLLFVAVESSFRGKGYGEKLTRYAIQDLFSMGVGVVELLTRTNNVKARSLYKKIGFKEDRIEDGFVYYSLRRK